MCSLVAGQSNYARSVCDETVLRLQLRPLSFALVEHGEREERQAAGDLSRELVQEEHGRQVPVARIRREFPRSRLDSSKNRRREHRRGVGYRSVADTGIHQRRKSQGERGHDGAVPTAEGLLAKRGRRFEGVF